MALLGLNPLVVVGVVNGGHNDALVGLAVLAGVLLAEDRRPAASGVAFGLGLLVKPVALLPLLAVALWLWRRRGPRPAATTAGVAGVLGLAGYQAGGGVLAAVRATGGVSDLVTRFSLWRVTWMATPPAVGEATEHSLHASGGFLPSWLPITIVVTAAVAAAAAWSWRRTPEGSWAGSPAAPVGVAVVCFLLGGLYVLPWYVMWVLPVLALRWTWRVTWIAVVDSWLLLVAYALALQKAFGPGATVARAIVFDVLAVAELAALVAVLYWTYRGGRAVRTAPVGRRPDGTSSQPVSAGFEPRPSGTGRTAS
jgi:hypothetical protein